jgi:phospholipid/cholesterol/gamma-HCH transport system substrate-binding protein
MLHRAAGQITASKGLFLGAVVAGGVFGMAFLNAGSGSHHVTARFSDADGLVPGNEVRIAGVKAGSVDSVKVGTDGHGAQFAEAQLTIDPSDWPLRQGTMVAVRPRGVLSEVFVDIQPASRASTPLPDGFVYDVSKTSSPTNLDELSNVFDPNVRTSIRTQLQEGVLAFGGNGATGLNQTIANLRPLLQDVVPVTDVLATRTPELDRLNVEFDKVSGDLAREDAHLRSLIADSNTTFQALAVKEQQLQGTLVHAAGTLASIDAGLKGEETNLRQIFAKGPKALSDAKNTADLLTPLITAVNPHIPSLDVLLNEFVTATGFCAHQPGTPDCSGSIDTLRVNATLPPTDRSSYECGGAPSQQQGLVGKAGCPSGVKP